MNRRPELKTRRDMAIVETDSRGNARHLIVIPDEEAPAPIVHTEAAQLPTRPAATSRAAAQVTGSYQDRARGFSHVTLNLALVTGLAVLTAAVFLQGGALTLAATLVYFMSGFFATWLIAYILHVFVSPEGVEFVEVFMYWRFIGREQEERHRRMRPQRATWPMVVGRLVIALVTLIAAYAVWGN
jgi:small-conductance mechanosensitive channel